MNPWRQFPLLRLILPVFLGMITGISSDTGFRFPLVFPGLIFLCLGFLVFFPKFILSWSFRWVTGLLIFLLTTLFSFQIMMTGKDTSKSNYFGTCRTVQNTWIGEITEPVVQKDKTTKVIMRITCLQSGVKWVKTEGKALVYFGASPSSRLLSYGDRLVMRTSFTIPPGAQNPGGFDSQRYLRLKGICRQAFIRPDHWKHISGGTRNPIVKMALSWRDKMLTILRNNGLRGQEFAVAGALLLGYVDEVDTEIMHDYSATGVMHILSVSGMHVGMIFLVLEKLLGFLEKRKNGIYIKAVLVIICTWLYALITGLSPAVMRAAAMLSLIVLGKSMKRHPEILNILAASIIFLVVWQPSLIADLGFQLSYLAVGGIVLLYKPVYDLIVPGNSLVDKIWSIVAVSIAAQLATLPLCLYYFHQFPNYFMITNIIVIPLSNLIIYTGILALAVGAVPWISVVVAKALSLMVWFLNVFIHWMGALPMSVTRGISITFAESILLYAILITLGIFILEKKKIWLFLSLFILIFLSGDFLLVRIQRASGSTFTVYDVKNNGLSDYASGGKSILVGRLSALKDPFFRETITKSRWSDKVTGLFEFQCLPGSQYRRAFHYGGYFYKKDDYLGFRGKRIAILTQKIPARSAGSLDVDYLVLSGNPKVRLQDIIKHIRAKVVIIDASNSSWRAAGWMKEAHWLGMRCHSVAVSGAFQERW